MSEPVDAGNSPSIDRNSIHIPSQINPCSHVYVLARMENTISVHRS